MNQLVELAGHWLSVADRLGWGVEGPRHARIVRLAVQQLADGEESTVDLSSLADRPLGTRPVDALTESAGLICEAASATGLRRAELISAARGWLVIAEA